MTSSRAAPPLADSRYAMGRLMVTLALMTIGAAGMYVVIEGWLNQQTHNKIRGRIFTLYAALNNLALLAGQYLFTLGDPRGYELFSIAAILTMACMLPVALTRQPESQRRHFQPAAQPETSQ